MPVVPDLRGGADRALGKAEPHQAVPSLLLFRARQPRRTELPQGVRWCWPLGTCSVAASLLHMDGRDRGKDSKSSKPTLSHARAR